MRVLTKGEAHVVELVRVNRYPAAVAVLVALPRLERFHALVECVPHLGSFGEVLRADVKRSTTAEEAVATLVALEGAELVEADGITEAAMASALEERWAPPPPPQTAPAFVHDLLAAVAAAEGEQALAEQFAAIRDGAAHVAEVAAHADVADADALVAAVQNAASEVGGAAAERVTDPEAAARAWKRSVDGDGRSGVWLTVRVPTELAARVEAAVDLLPRATAPASGWSRSAAIREALAAGLDVLERKARRRQT